MQMMYPFSEYTNLFMLLLLNLLNWGSFSTAQQLQAAGDTVYVKGVLGGKTRLPCHVDVDNCGEVYFITWTKSDQGRPDSELWTRIYLYSDAVEKPLRDLVSRAKFSLDAVDPLSSGGWLTLDKIKPSDETYYKCDVTYIQGKCPSLTLVHLEVLVMPAKASIVFGNEVVKSGGSIGPLNEGDELRLKCMVSGGKPRPTLTWHRIDKKGQSEQVKEGLGTHVEEGDLTWMELSKKLSRSDLNTKYECQVSHESISSDKGRLDARLDLDLNVGALSLELIGPLEEVRESDIVQLQCIAYGSRPQVKIKWINGSQVIENVKERYEIEGNEEGTVTTRSIVELVVSRHDHLALVECQASNPAMERPLVGSTELRVRFAMEPQTGLMINESTDSVNMYCTYNANPSNLLENQTRWFKDGQELRLNTFSVHYITRFSGYPILTILNASREDSGSYFCEVANAMGKGRPLVPLQLSIVYQPSVVLHIYPDPTQGILVKEGDDLRLICEVVDGNPLNVSRVKWIRKGGEDGDEVVSNETSQNEIVWAAIDRSASGNYSCSAANEAGWSDPSADVPVDVKYLPGQAAIEAVSGEPAAKGSDLVLECVVRGMGRPAASEFLWEQNGLPLDNHKQSMVHFQKLRITDKGNYSCSAVSSAGIGPKGYYDVDPMAPPTLIEALPPYNGALYNTSRHSVWCRVECQPICEVNWYRNGEYIDPNTTLEFHVQQTMHPEEAHFNTFISVVSTLHWNMTVFETLDRFEDNANFSCVSTATPAGPAVESHMRFFVEYPPENLVVRPKRIDVIEWDIPPEIVCESDALPAPSYRWQYWQNLIADSQVLSLNHSISRDREGLYTCVASNRHGEATVSVLMNVLYAPECVMSQSKEGDAEDSDIILICEVRANPKTGLNFTWYLNGTILNETIAEDVVKQEGSKSSINISTSSGKLFGLWTCAVANSIGNTDPNCSMTLSGPIMAPRWTMPKFDDESILWIVGLIVALVLLFLIILIVLFLLMRRYRGKQGVAHQVGSRRENPDGSRSPTPSSVTSYVPSTNQVITYKRESNLRLKRNDKVIDTNQKEAAPVTSTPTKGGGGGKDPQQEQPLVQGINKDMYENMAFHRKKGMLLTSGGPNFLPHYQNIAQLTNDLRRTQSARFTEKPFGMDVNDDLLYADLYEDVKAGKIPDPRVKPPLPPKGAKPPKGPKRPPKEGGKEK